MILENNLLANCRILENPAFTGNVWYVMSLLAV